MKHCQLCIPILLFFLLVIGGCGKGSVDPGGQAPVWPLKIGNQWIYHTTMYDSLGVVIYEAQDTMRVVADTMVHGELWYLLGDGSRAINRKDGYWYWYAEKYHIEEDEPYHFLKYPIRLGDTVRYFHGKVLFSSGLAATVVNFAKVLLLDTLVHVRAGGFHCFETTVGCRLDDGSTSDECGDSRSRYLYSTGLGLVLGETNEATSDGRIYLGVRSELISATIRH